MKLQTLHEGVGASFKGMGEVVSEDTWQKAEEAFNKHLKGLKQVKDSSFGDKWTGEFTDGLSNLQVVIWRTSAGDRTYIHYTLETAIEIVEFLNPDDDTSAKYFEVGAGFTQKSEILEHMLIAPKVLAEQINRFADWYFDMSGSHGKLKLIKKGDITNGVTFYAVGGKIENSVGASSQEEPKVY